MKHFIILLACLQYSMTLHEKEWPTQHQSLNPGCPDGWLDGGHLGCFLFLHQETSLSWTEAQGICEQHGGFLVEVKDEEQQNFIESSAIIEESLTGVTSWWLGLTDSEHEGRWVWSHSDTDASFTSWTPGHPNSSPDNQDDCVSISLEDHFHWKDVSCFNQSQTSPSPICHRVSHPQTTTGFLLLGGWDDHSNYLDNVEAYGSDLSLPSIPSLPLPLVAPIAEMTESGVIYLAGGQTSHGSINNKTLMLSSLSSSKWEEVEARMPIPVWMTGSVVVKDIVLVLGGYSDSGESNVIQMLDTSKSLPTWKLLNQTKLPEPLYWHSAAVFEGQVIIVTQFAVTYTTSVSSIISDTELEWVKGELPDVPGGGVSGPSVEVVEGKLVAVWGMWSGKVFTKTTMDSQWVQLEPFPQFQKKMLYPSIGSVLGNIVVGGGNDDQGSASSTVFLWLEASNEWEEAPSLKIKREKHATVQLPRGIL